MKRLLNMSIYKKIIILLISLSLIPLLLVSTYAYSFFNNLLFEMITKSNLEVLDQTANHTEEIYEDMNDILDKVSLHPSIQSTLMDTSENDWQSYQNARFFSEYTNLLRVGYPEISKISIHNHQGKRYDSVGRYLDPYDNEYTPYQEIEKKLSKGSMVISSTYTGKGGVKMISYGKRIFDLSNGQNIGTAVVDIDLNYLSESFAETRLLRSGYIVLLNEDNEVIYHPVLEAGEKGPAQLLAIEPGSDYSLHKTKNDEEFLFLPRELPQTGWKLIGVVPYTEVSEKLTPIRNQFLLIAAMIVISVIIFATLIHRLLVKPIKKLQKSMNKVQSGDFSIRVNFNRNDEIGNLGSHFNDMVNQIEVLINRVYQVELNESRALLLQKQAEITALQEKITPHFLYNTLNTISWFAYRRGVREIQLVVDSLGNMLRYNLKSDSKLVELKEEIKYLKLYVDIIDFRYENEFTFSYKLEKEIEDTLVPRLFLQPIVENAVKHGFVQEQQEKTIQVEIKQNQENIIIEVKDNGVGITEERMVQINRKLYSTEYDSISNIDEPDGIGIGLVNVHQRLHLTYGDPYGIALQSEPDKGTIVTLTFPYKTMWGEENDTDNSYREHQHGYSQLS